MNHDILEFSKKSSIKRIQMICEHLKPQWVAPYAAGLRFKNKNLIHNNRLFFSLGEIFNHTFGSTIPIYVHPGQKISTHTDFKNLIYSPYHNLLETINELPSHEDQPLLSLSEKNHFEKIYSQMLIEESQDWLNPLHLSIKVQNKDALDHSFNLYFNGHQVTQSSTLDNIDLEIIYDRSPVKYLLSGRWNFQQVHYSYQWKVIVYKIVPNQMKIPHWGKIVKLLEND